MTRLSPLPIAVRARLFSHLAAMEKAGIPPDRSYALLDLGPSLRQPVQAFQKLYARGMAPPGAGAASGLFTPFEQRLLEAAFRAGSPYPSFDRLARRYTDAAQQRTQLRARMAAPVATLVIAIIVAPIPQLAHGIISGGGYAWKVLWPLALLAMAPLALRRLGIWFDGAGDSAARRWCDRALLALPLVGDLHRRGVMCDFVASLALLLQAGDAMFDALPVARASASSAPLRDDLASLLPAMEKGATLSQALTALRLVDTVQLRAFAHTGEESGTLASMLERYANGETEALALARKEVMTWLPRVFYSAVALWMIAQLLAPTR